MFHAQAGGKTGLQQLEEYLSSTNTKCRTNYQDRDCIQRKTWFMGPHARVNFNSPCLIVNSVVSYPPLSTPTTKGKEWERFLLLLELLISNNKQEKGEYE
jgi:hypothetical protein